MLWPLVTIHTGAETIHGQKLYEETRYLLFIFGGGTLKWLNFQLKFLIVDHSANKQAWHIYGLTVRCMELDNFRKKLGSFWEFFIKETNSMLTAFFRHSFMNFFSVPVQFSFGGKHFTTMAKQFLRRFNRPVGVMNSFVFTQIGMPFETFATNIAG